MRVLTRGAGLGMLAAAVALAQHPLAPLSADEIHSATKIFHDSGHLPAGARFSELKLQEPPKDSVLRGQGTPRQAFAVIYGYQTNQTFEGIADLTAHRVVSWHEVPGAQPAITSEDSSRAEQAMRADPRFRRAMSERGIRDLDNVLTVAWSAGYFALPGTEKDRIVRAVCYYGGAGENLYAHPIEGVSAHVDVTTRKVLDFTDID